MTSFISRCASRGYRAVELDNLDTFTRSDGLLSYAANGIYARLLIMAGHKRGLAMAQKNTPDQSKDLKVAGFDFAIAEQCQIYGRVRGVHRRIPDRGRSISMTVTATSRSHFAYSTACSTNS